MHEGSPRSVKSRSLDSAAKLSKLLFVSGNATRLELVLLLTEGPSDVSGIAREMELDLPYVCQHLRVLRDSGMVTREICRNRRIYELSRRVQVTRDASHCRLQLRGRDDATLALVMGLEPEGS